MPDLVWHDVVAHESARGSVTIVGRPRGEAFRARFRFGPGRVDEAKAWLRAHAPNGWVWKYPDRSRVVVTIAQAAHERVIARHAPVFNKLANLDVARCIANTI